MLKISNKLNRAITFIAVFSIIFAEFAAIFVNTAAACDNCGSGICAAASGVVDLNPPQAPFMTFPRNAATGGKVIISWRIPSDKELIGFNIYRSASSGGMGKKIATLSAAASSLQDCGLSNGATYYYTISSFDASNNEAFAPQMAAVPTLNSVVLYPDGTLLRFQNRSTVYKVGTDGKTLYPVSKKIFDTNGYKFSKVAEIPIEWMNSFYYGGADTFKDGTLLRANGELTVYVMENGLKRPFVSKNIFTDLGYNFKNVVVISSSGAGMAENLDNYTTGAEINSLASHPNGALVKASGDQTIYLISNSQKRPFSTFTAFQSYNYDLKKVLAISVAELNGYFAGQVMRFSDGSLIQDNNKAVYAVNNGGADLVPFRSAIEFAGLGFKFENVVSASEGDISRYHLAEPLPI